MRAAAPGSSLTWTLGWFWLSGSGLLDAPALRGLRRPFAYSGVDSEAQVRISKGSLGSSEIWAGLGTPVPDGVDLPKGIVSFFWAISEGVDTSHIHEVSQGLSQVGGSLLL